MAYGGRESQSLESKALNAAICFVVFISRRNGHVVEFVTSKLFLACRRFMVDSPADGDFVGHWRRF
jgi:hypothetical protein